MKLIRKFAGRAVVLAGLTLSAAAMGGSTAPVLVHINNGDVITEEDLSQYLDRRVDLRAASRNAWGVEGVVREMAFTRILMLEGEAMGELRRTDEAPTRFDDKFGHAIYKKLMPACPPPADESAERIFYNQHPQAFHVPPMARLSRVMLPVSETLDGEAAPSWLLKQVQAMAASGKKMEDVAQQAAQLYKLDPQGDLGWVTLTDDVTILRALADAQQGDLVGPVREGEFVYLFQILAKREGRTLRWDEVAPAVAGRAVRYCIEQGNTELRERLFKKYAVELDQANIRALFNKKETKK